MRVTDDDLIDQGDVMPGARHDVHSSILRHVLRGIP